MFTIETFTAQADHVEDRIRLDAVDTEGKKQSIFVTRRMADRFLPVLVKLAERGAKPGVPKQIGLAMSQQQLRIERQENRLPDVVPAPDCRPWLCRTVQLNERGGTVEWVLTDDADHTAAMALAGPGARVVLDVFLLMYRRLEWTQDPFPAWLTEDADASVGAQRTLN